MDNTDQPSSICHVGAEQIYPIPPLDPTISLPFNLLCGEAVHYTGHSSDGLLVLTNYRIYIELGDSQHHVPLGLIEIVEHREMFYLHIGCKDARSYKCTFDNNEQCLEWFSRLMKASSPPRELEDLFAFRFYAWASERGNEDVVAKLEMNCGSYYDGNNFKSEVERLQFDLHGAWRISQVNSKYKLCGSYPPLLLVPACITDETLETVARFRSSRRIPAVVWRHQGNGAVIARCSQPEVGWLGWRSAEDEDLLKAIADACNFDHGPRSMLDNNSTTPTSSVPDDSTSTSSSQELTNVQNTTKKVLIMDARSYTTAVANRARGGGCECPEYYPSCEIQFMNLANIHSIRKSFHALRQLCASNADQPNWFSLLEGTRWLQHMSGLMRAAETLVAAVERDARPVLVHCSDGWDRTPQIVALAELLLDPFYRTVDGFRILVEREWLSFGHKFADRCGHAAGTDDQNERCPVFLQWLDCVHQLIKQCPCQFQFSHTYLVKLAQHTYSNLFGTFLCNTKQEREERVAEKTFSVWKFLNTQTFRNHLYCANGPRVIWPQCNVRDLRFWSEVYLGSLETTSTAEGPSGVGCPCPAEGTSHPHMTKTRSYGDLIGAADSITCPNHFRRSSDPSITVDTIKLNNLNISQSAENGIKGDDEMDGRLKNGNGHLIHQDDRDQIVMSNGHSPSPSPGAENYLSHFENESLLDNCNSDCIFKDDAKFSQHQHQPHHNLHQNIFMENNSASWQSHNNVKLPTNNVIRICETDNLDTLRNKNNHIVETTAAAADDVTAAVTGNGTCNGDIIDGIDDDDDDVEVDDDDEEKTNRTLVAKSDINHNGLCSKGDDGDEVSGSNNKCMDLLLAAAAANDDEDEEENDQSESKSEVTLCDSSMALVAGNGVGGGASGSIGSAGSGSGYGSGSGAGGISGAKETFVQSVETSTETLVAENGVISSSTLEDRPKADTYFTETNHIISTLPPQLPLHPILHQPAATSATNNQNQQQQQQQQQQGNNDVCKVCAQNRRFISDKQNHNHHIHSGSTSGKNSRYSTPPLYSRTPSAGGWDSNQPTSLLNHTLLNGRHQHSYYNQLEVDGMKRLRCDMQNRLAQIVEEFRIKEEALQRELHTTRQALIQQVCHNCNHNDGDKQDDTGSTVDSVCSAGEGQISAGESLPSDMSWEAVEDGPGSDGIPTLWVPDHAVSRCTGCQTEFWLGRRKHHCRNCGRIFCADCSENSTPLPSEQLFSPVRVCTACFCQLKGGTVIAGRGCGEQLPTDHCKHPNSAHTNGNPPPPHHQITASSN